MSPVPTPQIGAPAFGRQHSPCQGDPSLRIAANQSSTLRTRWCSSAATAHTAQSNFSGTDANGRAWSVTGPVVRLQAR